MNTETIAGPTVIRNRRRVTKIFAVLAAAIGLTSSAALADPQPTQDRLQKVNPALFSFYAEGVGTFDNVIGYRWPAALGNKQDAILAGMTFKVVYQFPYEHRDVLQLSVYLLPTPWDPPGTTPLLISRALSRIDEIRLSTPVAYPEEFGLQPKPTIALLGQVIENDVPSPFGPIVGRVMSVTAGFDAEGQAVQFYLLGGSAVGGHATYLTNATGSISFNSHQR